MSEVISSMKKWNWDFIFACMKDIETEMDSPTWRFLKSEVLSRAIVKGSNGDLTYVDQVGYDFVFQNEIRIEYKSEKKVFNKNGSTKKLKLKNTQGNAQQLTQTFDYLLIIQTKPPYRASVVTFENVSENIEVVSDGIKVQLPKNCLNNLTPEEGHTPVKQLRERFGISRKKNGLKDSVDELLDNWVEDTFWYNTKGFIQAATLIAVILYLLAI